MLKKNVILKSWKRYSWSDKIFMGIVYGSLILITLMCLYPLYFTVMASFSDAYAVYRGEVNLLPKGFTTVAYELVYQNKDIWVGYKNTIIYTFLGTIFNLFLTIPAAYGLSKKQMLGRNFLMTIFLITMYFGGGMIPTYLLMKTLHLTDTRLLMIISGGLSVYNTIVTRTYFQNNIPDSLFEAARIDGAGELRVFLKIVIPLSAPIIAVMTLYYAVGHWNSYFTALIYLKKSDLHPLQLVLRRILILSQAAYETAMQSDASAEELANAAKKAYQALTMKYAMVFIGSAPMLILYPFVQKYFVKGVMLGSVKS